MLACALNHRGAPIWRPSSAAGPTTRLGNIPKLWLYALTVVHELSHKLVKTEDIRYDYDGLKPGNGFKTEDALNNADSWAYFAGDLVGAIPKNAIKKALG